MPELRHNTLTEPMIRARLPGGEERDLTLPEVLGQLSCDDIEAFCHLRPHQTHAWHAFLVQLAAIALHRAGLEIPPGEPAVWCDLLRALTEGDEAPWCLVVEDLSRPAFLQPPVPEGSLSGFKNRLTAPDALDILVTAKNHDVKALRMTKPRLAHWLFALLTLQTMQGFLGAGNYGIVRMNGGFSSRACVSITPGLRTGARFLRDVQTLLATRQSLVNSHGLADRGGLALLWLAPWDGSSSLAWEACDPFFIEVCRRIRLVDQDGLLTALASPTKTRRLQAEDRKGDTGDPWTPVQRAKGTALTVSGSGFTYRLSQELIFGGDFEPGGTQVLQSGDGEGSTFYAWALVRGQGKTEGLHERRLPLPGKVRVRLGSPAGRETLGALSKRRVEIAASVQKQVLRPALCALLQAGASRLDFTDDRPHRWLDAFDQSVDRVFFDALWPDLDVSEAEASRNWERLLLGLARAQLESAIAAAPIPAISRFRAVAAAERMFDGLKRKHFPELVPIAKGEA
jgi:CRISPR system Cascade subunit CasA